MPYKSNSDLPEAVRNALPTTAQTIFRGAFNGSYEQSGEEAANKIAWAAVKQKFKKEGEKWVARDSAEQLIIVDDEWVGKPPTVQHCMYDEALILDADNMRFTQDGYLAVMPRVARTGIQRYRGSEIGRDDMEWVNVYRPEDQVFDAASMRTFAHKPITDDHPAEPVTAANWKDHAVGIADADVVRDGEFVRVPMLIMDAAMIQKIKDGKRELSVGYGADLVWGKGKTPTGEFYDAMQMDIVVNHIAAVKAARGGPQLRIGDKGTPSPTEKTIMTKRILVDGVGVELEDTAASMIERHFQRLGDQITKLTADNLEFLKKKEEEEAKDKKTAKDMEAKDAQIAVLQTQLADAKKAAEISPEKLQKLVADRAEVVGKAKAILGDKLVVDGKSDHEIRVQVVDAKLGDKAKGWSEDKVAAGFEMLTVDAKVDDGANGISHDFSKPGWVGTGFGDAAKRDKAYNTYDSAISERWKNKVA